MSTKPHDSLFHDTFEHPEHARGELQHLLGAALAARFDWSTLELVPGSFVSEELRDSHSDLLFRAQLGGHETNGVAAMGKIWQYVMAVHEGSHERVLPALAAALDDEEQRQNMATIAEQLIEKGKKRGFEEGKKEGEKSGIEKGQRGLLLRQLERRFGPLPAAVRERVGQAKSPELERWVDRVLTAATLAEVLDGAA